MKEKREEFYREQIELYTQKRDDFKVLNVILRQILEIIASKCSSTYILQDRVKLVSSFVEKITRQTHYKNPIEEITDIAGLRVIFPVIENVHKCSRLIQKNFYINPKLSGKRTEKLGISEFGYRSTHFSVRLNKEMPILEEIQEETQIEIPNDLYDLKAEIQVRTFLEHAWASIYHEIGFKGRANIPSELDRDLHRLSATLEGADHSLTNLYSEVKNYELNYDAYLDEEEIIEEIERLELILKYKESCDVEDEGIDILKKITQMAKSIGDWKKIIRNVKKSSSDLQNSVILKNLGIALIKTNSYGSEDYKQGIKYLERVIESDKTNADALSSLGGAYKGHDEKKARKYYQLAFEREPYNPYFLGNYLIYELREKESTELLTLAKPLIRKAIGRSKKQILMNLNIPWAYFDLGLFNLFLGKLNRSVYNYILGIRYSTDNWMISTTYETLELLNNIENNLSGYKVVKKLMLLKLATNSRDKKYMKTLEEKYISDNVKISPPVLIIAGTTSPRNMKKLATYEQNLLEALEHYKGTVISGGSTSGISGITGKIQEKYPQDIETIGYIPESEKKGEILDNRYSKIQFTPYPEFSVREAIQYWLDIYANNIRPREVKLIGLGGGKISRLEYGIALILGGEIGIFKNSGGIADQFLNNEDWASFQEGRYNKFHILDNKVNQIQKFL